MRKALSADLFMEHWDAQAAGVNLQENNVVTT